MIPEPARLATEPDTRAGPPPGTRVRLLRSAWPLMLRRTLPCTPAPIAAWSRRDATAAWVHLVAGGAGPLGGDRLRLEVDVGAGSTLVLGEVSPTLLLPGPYGEESRTEFDIRVGPRGTLVWLPQPVVPAAGCRHRTDVRITLCHDSRLLLREEVLFGRYGERPGALRQRLRAMAGGRVLYDQELVVGPEAPGWDGPAVTAGLHAAGTVLLADATLVESRHVPHPHSGGSDDHTAVFTLPGPGLAFTALAPDSATLRRRLDAAVGALLSRTGRKDPG
ncbi:urease accessory protein UreD [Sphaerimonospora sp. CA-214678]|uniref:urease accessory protein UreD n=1 Tax=Sphaerimonospora sp. CA-214678 TaxID=3240029 RepID=UPI003D8E7538